MKTNFDIEKINDVFMNIMWELKNTNDYEFVWSNIKNTPLINECGEPVGILNNFTLDYTDGYFKIKLGFTAWSKLISNSFKTITMSKNKYDIFEFKIK